MGRIAVVCPNYRGTANDQHSMTKTRAGFLGAVLAKAQHDHKQSARDPSPQKHARPTCTHICVGGKFLLLPAILGDLAVLGCCRAFFGGKRRAILGVFRRFSAFFGAFRRF